MKKILSILLGITLAVSSSVAFAADTTTVYTSMASENTVKLCTVSPVGYSNSKCLATLPITFADGTTWKDVKHSYDVSSTEAAALNSKCARITVHGDGGISVTTTTCKTKSKK